MDDSRRDIPQEEAGKGKEGSRRETTRMSCRVDLMENIVQTGLTCLVMSLGRIMDRNKHRANKQKSNNQLCKNTKFLDKIGRIQGGMVIHTKENLLIKKEVKLWYTHRLSSKQNFHSHKKKFLLNQKLLEE